MRRTAFAALALAALLGPMTAGAAAQSADDEQGAVPHVVRDEWAENASVPQPWEETGIRLALLTEAVIAASSEDEATLIFDSGDELGSFRPAPEGGSPFFGAAAPLFGMAAPTVGPDGLIRPLGGDDRFLAVRTVVEADPVIPPLGSTPDERRASFAFIGEIPPIGEDDLSSGGPRPQVIDVPDTRPVTGPTPGTTTPPRPDDAPRLPVPGPDTDEPRPPTPTTSRPPIDAPVTTQPPRPSTTTTTSPEATTATTRPPTTTTTRPTPVTPPPADVGASLVLGNQREGGTQCFSNDDGGTHNPECDQLFDIGGGMRPGQSYTVDLTLWNAEGRSDTDAAELRTYAPAACDPSSSGAADLCEAIQLTIQRYTSSDRSTPAECVYGGGSGTSCSMSSSHTIGAFARAHTSMTNGARVVPGAFRVSDRAYLRITVRLPDLGFTDGGIGRSNPYSGQTASWSVRWEMRSA